MCRITIGWSPDRGIYEDILFNQVKGPDSWFINVILLSGKQYIYNSKCKQRVPKVVEFVAILHKLEKAEYLIALKNNKLQKHKKKWKSLYKAF